MTFADFALDRGALPQAFQAGAARRLERRHGAARRVHRDSTARRARPAASSLHLGRSTRTTTLRARWCRPSMVHATERAARFLAAAAGSWSASAARSTPQQVADEARHDMAQKISQALLRHGRPARNASRPGRGAGCRRCPRPTAHRRRHGAGNASGGVPADYEPAWIDTPECTTCDECILINPKIFAYDDQKHAYVANPRGGPYSRHRTRGREVHRRGAASGHTCSISANRAWSSSASAPRSTSRESLE
ncbi:MAG: ferredoxin [Chromatiales bacterium]|nr:ferredoxin [Chromatiales bacterium]